MKRRVYFNEFNIVMADAPYLPLVSGLLQSYAQTFTAITDNYQFMPFNYTMTRPEEILAKYTEPPDVAAFSSVSWNEQLNYAVASEIKRRYPDCLIVFGGPNVPMPPQHDVREWIEAHSFVDVAVRAEGEEPFADILLRNLEEPDFRNIPGVACWQCANDAVQFCDIERPFKRNLSELPSPYLDGLYEDMMQGKDWTAIIETNRGCPFPCT